MTIQVKYQNTAVIDVDPQQGFTDLCPNELPVKDALAIVPELIKNHTKGRFKLVSRDLHPPKAAWDAETPANMLQPVGLPQVLEYDFQVNKGMDPNAHPYGVFFHDIADTITTGANEFLKFNRVDTLVIGGLALDFCVKKSISQALTLGFNVIVNLASTRAVLPEKSTEVIADLEKQGAIFVATADEIVSDLIL